MVARIGLVKRIHWRLFFVFLLFALLGLAILARLFSLQILHYREFAEAAAAQQGRAGDALPRRGAIYLVDKDGERRAVALNRDTFTLSAVPKNVSSPEEAAVALAPILSLSADDIAQKLMRQNDPYEIIQRKLDEDTANRIRLLGFSGISLSRESRRLYPSGELAAHVLGYVKFDNDQESGQYGLERLYEQQLKGETGILEGVGNSETPVLALGRRILHPPENGKSLVLTIDYNIQARAEEKLDMLVKQWNAESGSVTVVDPFSGKILALAARPAFDPNNPGSVENLRVFQNPVVEGSYELGSVMKPITMAAALNEGVITPDTRYDDTGEVKIKGLSIHNYDGKAHGTQTMTQVLEKSLNTGAVFAEQKLGQQKFLKYLKQFGFGEKTGADLPGEVRGNISNLSKGREIDFATAAFGQGIAVTPLQMIAAMSAIANGGNLMKPYVVDRIVDDAGVEEVTKPEVKRRVITAQTAETLSKMLVSVTRNGFDNRAGITGYFIAGKTGTAQIPNAGTKGYSEDVIHSFAGYAPAFNPKFLVFIQLNRPKGVNFASSSLTPTFHDLAAYILDYYGVPPDER